MIDKDQELQMDINQEYMKLNEAYVVGDEVLTLTNLGIDISKLNERELKDEYLKVVERIRSVTNLLVKNFN